MTEQTNNGARDSLNSRLERLWERPTVSPGESDSPMISHYRVRTALGSGAFAIVYLAHDTRNNQLVALKLPRPDALLDTERKKRFATEAQILTKLQHDHLVQVNEVGESKLIPYIAMEWCDGPDLGRWLADRSTASQPLPEWRDAVATVKQIADAIDYVHRQGIIHRDLKPANILLARKKPDLEDDSEVVDRLGSYVVKVSDFGLSKWTDAGLTQTRSSLMLGTPLYMAPEQVDWKKRTSIESPENSTAADIYSIGAILFELLTGQPPVEGEHYFEVLDNIRSSPARRLSQFRADLPTGLSRVCDTCLHQNPNARYETAAHLAADLEHCLNGQSVVGRSTSVSQRYGFWHSNQPWAITAGRFAIIFCGLMACWMVITSAGLWFYQVVSVNSYKAMAGEVGMMLLTSTIPMGIIGWLCMKQKRWAIGVGLAVNCLIITAAILGMLGRPLAFQALYRTLNIYVCFTIHLFIFLAYAFQQILFLFAWFATRPQTNCK